MPGNLLRVFAMGVLAGMALFMVIIMNGEPVKVYNRIHEMKEQCEQNLPRNDHCVVIAVPVSKD